MLARTPPPRNRNLPAPAGTHAPGPARRSHPTPVLLALLALASCEGGPGGGPETPTALTIRSGDGQTADARTAVPEPPTVLVTGASGNGIGGVTVNFAVYSGGGSVASATAVTGTDGVASAGAWTLGDPGTQELRASVAGLNPVLFTATALDVPTTLAIHAGDGQRAVAGAAVPGPVQVRVNGVAGAAVEGVTVGFEVTAGGGSVESATAATDADGIASPGAWTLGDPGPQELRAPVAGLDPVLFTATAVDVPTTLAIHAGDGQRAVAGAAVPGPVQVRVTGVAGAALEGVTVGFEVTVGGGSVESATAATDGDGIASPGAWTLGDPGTQELRASVAGLNPVLFTATALDVPTTLVIHAGDGQSAVAGVAVPGPVQVRVTGVAGAAVEGVTVGFEVTAGGGSVESATAATDADGIASPGAWTLGDPGPQELRATVAGLDPVLFTATAVDVPTTLAIHAGDGQRAFAGSAVPGPVQVRVTGVAGAALEGVTVGFEVTAGGGSVESATAATDGDGIASPGAWTLGDPGPQQLRASVTELDPVLFTATALDVPTTLVIHAGDGQRAVAGAAVPGPVQVRVTGVAGTAVEGVTVGFEVTAGGGSVESATAATDADGIASPGAWTLGDPGPQELRATVAGLDPVLFTATAVDVPTTLAIHAGDGQRAFAGSAVPGPVQVRVTGVAGAALEGVTVGFEVTAGGGSVESATAATDGDGIASPGAWTLGDPGPQELRATVAELDPVTVRATALKVPARVAVVAGTGQEVPVATPVPVPPAVLVSDSAGAPLPGVTVTFETGGGAEITGARAVTDTLGRAAVGSWTLGTTTGVYRLEAAVDGDGIEGNPAFIEALAVPGPATEIVIVAGDDQVSEAKLPVPVSPRIQVRDAHGNGVNGLTARFEAGGGSVAIPSRSETGGGGFAGVDRWILGARENVGYRLTAEVHDGDRSVGTVRFAATSTASVYDIVIEHADSSVLSEAQLAAFAKAEAFWEKAVQGNLGWSTLRKASLEWCLSLAEIDYEIPGDRVVDDLLIYADTREIDGLGGVLAGAGPCQIRREGSLPVVGVMFFDIEDMTALETQEEGRHLEGTILHEMAHVMGFGTLWEYVGLLEDPVDPNNPTGMEDPHFVGDSALKAFSGIGGDDYTGGEPVPAENLGGTGVVNGHWRESVFQTELMSPFIDGGVPNPLSVVTLASFQDLGYREVDLSVADEYELPSAAAALADLIATGGDILRIPMAVVDRDGRVIRYVLPRRRSSR